MNTINFVNDKKKFPLSTDGLAFFQAMIKQVAQLANIGGTGNYILSGCVNTTGNTWTPGYVVINGEICAFSGGTGTSASSVRIKETSRNVTADYDTYTNAYVTRVAEFGSNVGATETYAWNTFSLIKTNTELEAEKATKLELAALQNLVMPKGGIIMWSGTTANIPTGFHLCNGDTVTDYGVVPDLRGRFIVGLDTRINQSLATDVTDKTLNYGVVGSKGGKPNVTLSAAESGMPSHTISFPGAVSDIDGTGSQKGYEPNGTTSITVAAKNAGESHENRPPYFVLAFIIKVI